MPTVNRKVGKVRRLHFSDGKMFWCGENVTLYRYFPSYLSHNAAWLSFRCGCLSFFPLSPNFSTCISKITRNIFNELGVLVHFTHNNKLDFGSLLQSPYLAGDLIWKKNSARGHRKVKWNQDGKFFPLRKLSTCVGTSGNEFARNEVSKPHKRTSN